MKPGISKNRKIAMWILAVAAMIFMIAAEVTKGPNGSPWDAAIVLAVGALLGLAAISAER